MRSLVEGTEFLNSLIGEDTRFKQVIQTLLGTTTLQAGTPPLLFIDPGGAARLVNLPPEKKGLFYIVVNTADAAENITLRDDTGVTTVLVVGQFEIGLVFSNGTSWFGFSGVA